MIGAFLFLVFLAIFYASLSVLVAIYFPYFLLVRYGRWLSRSVAVAEASEPN